MPTQITNLRSESPVIFENIIAEQQILGAVLTDNSVFNQIADILRPEFFADPVHRRIYELAGGRILKGHLVSPITMKLALESDDGLKQLGGPAYLARMAGAAISGHAAPDYARQIVEAAARRALQGAAQEAQVALSGGRDSAEIKMGLLHALQSVPEGGEESSYSLLKAVTEATQATIEAYQGNRSFLKTEIGPLDRIIKGLAPGDYCLVCGATSMGKTSLAIEIASNVAYRGEGVVFVSLEMTRQELANRMAAAKSRIPYTDLRDPSNMPEEDFRRYIEAAREVSTGTMRIVPRTIRDIPAIHAAISKAGTTFRAGKPALAVVDYAQLVRAPGKSRLDQMVEVSIGLKQMAGLLEIPIIALCQLSRDIGKRDDKRPQLSDIKETGQFENDADQVIFCHREAYWLQRQGPTPSKDGTITDQAKLEWQADIKAVENVMELIVRKNRHGPLATAEVGFHDATNRFWELKPRSAGFDGY